jgi:hypothetical protein
MIDADCLIYFGALSRLRYLRASSLLTVRLRNRCSNMNRPSRKISKHALLFGVPSPWGTLLLQNGTLYQDLGANHFDKRAKGRHLLKLVNRLKNLGFAVQTLVRMGLAIWCPASMSFPTSSSLQERFAPGQHRDHEETT